MTDLWLNLIWGIIRIKELSTVLGLEMRKIKNMRNQNLVFTRNKTNSKDHL